MKLLVRWDRVAREYRINFDKLLKVHERIMSKSPKVITPEIFKLLLSKASKKDKAYLKKYWKIEKELDCKQNLMFKNVKSYLYKRMELRALLINEILNWDTKMSKRSRMVRKFKNRY